MNSSDTAAEAPARWHETDEVTRATALALLQVWFDKTDNSEIGDYLYDQAEQMGRHDIRAALEGGELIGTVRAIAETWRTDPGAFPDGAADPLEQIATVLLGPPSTRKR